MQWRAIARSTVGTSHIKQQMPCQDYGGYKVLNNVIIGAVADGAGSAKSVSYTHLTLPTNREV